MKLILWLVYYVSIPFFVWSLAPIFDVLTLPNTQQYLLGTFLAIMYYGSFLAIKNEIINE